MAERRIPSLFGSLGGKCVCTKVVITCWEAKNASSTGNEKRAANYRLVCEACMCIFPCIPPSILHSIYIPVVNSFMELVEYLFSQPEVSFFLSNNLCQDPLENFFSQQRQRGRVNENPSVIEFLRNTQALRVINNTCSNIRGYCRGGKKNVKPTGMPLPKRRSKCDMCVHVSYIKSCLHFTQELPKREELLYWL